MFVERRTDTLNYFRENLITVQYVLCSVYSSGSSTVLVFLFNFNFMHHHALSQFSFPHRTDLMSKACTVRSKKHDRAFTIAF